MEDRDCKRGCDPRRRLTIGRAGCHPQGILRALVPELPGDVLHLTLADLAGRGCPQHVSRGRVQLRHPRRHPPPPPGHRRETLTRTTQRRDTRDRDKRPRSCALRGMHLPAVLHGRRRSVSGGDEGVHGREEGNQVENMAAAPHDVLNGSTEAAAPSRAPERT